MSEIKKVFICCIIVFILSAVRVYSINSKEYYPIELKYKLNECISLEGDFFNSINEKMDGYFITVLGTEIIPIEDFIKTYEALDTDYFNNQDYVYLVTANFNNVSNELNQEAGINLDEYIIQNGAYINYIERDVFSYVNDFDSYRFCLSPNTEKKVVIPFTISEQFINIDEFQNGEPQLVVSLYPHKKVVSLID